MKKYVFLLTVFLVTGCISVKPGTRFTALQKPLNDVNGNLKITYYGTTTLLFDDGETQLLFDCFFSRYSLLRTGMTKIKTNEKLINELFPGSSLKNLKAIFTAHSHYDHAMDVGYISNKTQATVYGSVSTLNIARGAGVGEERLADFAEMKRYVIGKFIIEVIPSRHSEPKWYNDDLGEAIDKPLKQPAGFRTYKEGGAFDFLIHHGTKTFLIRPSYSTVEGQWAGRRADYIFLGVTGMGDVSDEEKEKFYTENVTRLQPKVVIPVHHDDFFRPLSKPLRIIKSVPKGLDYLMQRTRQDSITLKMMDFKETLVVKTE